MELLTVNGKIYFCFHMSRADDTGCFASVFCFIIIHFCRKYVYVFWHSSILTEKCRIWIHYLYISINTSKIYRQLYILIKYIICRYRLSTSASGITFYSYPLLYKESIQIRRRISVLGKIGKKKKKKGIITSNLAF